jgi:hypothetical protein
LAVRSIMRSLPRRYGRGSPLRGVRRSRAAVFMAKAMEGVKSLDAQPR